MSEKSQSRPAFLVLMLFLLVGVALYMNGSMPEADAIIPEIKSEKPVEVEPAPEVQAEVSADSSSEEDADSLFVQELDLMVEALAKGSLKESCIAVSSVAVDLDGNKLPAAPGSEFEAISYDICTSFQELDIDVVDGSAGTQYQITVPLVSEGQPLMLGFEHRFTDLAAACASLEGLTKVRMDNWIDLLEAHEPDASLTVEMTPVCGQTTARNNPNVKAGSK